jgi:hypothetical protein
VALAVEEYVAANPGDVGLLGAPAVVASPERLADTVEQARLGRGKWTRFVDRR